MVRTAQLHGLYAAVRPSDRIRLKPVSALWKQVGDAGNATTQNHRIVLHNLVRLPRQRVRLYQVVGHNPRHVVEHHLHLYQFVAYAKVECVVLAFHHFCGRTLDDFLTVIIDEARGQLYKQGRHDDDSQASVVLDEVSHRICRLLLLPCFSQSMVSVPNIMMLVGFSYSNSKMLMNPVSLKTFLMSSLTPRITTRLPAFVFIVLNDSFLFFESL